MSERPDLVRHSEETILRVMLSSDVSQAIAVGKMLGVSKPVALRYYYRSETRSLRVADKYGFPRKLSREAKAIARMQWADA